jgi:mono/diheme cytochrome c family protein
MSPLYRFLVVGIGCLVIAAVGCGASGPTPPSGLAEAQKAGWQAYVDLNCGSCHGDLREGKRSGPVLAELKQHWDETELVKYLENPEAMIKTNPRLSYKAEKYPIDMPGYADKATTEQLTALAGYLLVDFD